MGTYARLTKTTRIPKSIETAHNWFRHINWDLYDYMLKKEDSEALTVFFKKFIVEGIQYLDDLIRNAAELRGIYDELPPSAQLFIAGDMVAKAARETRDAFQHMPGNVYNNNAWKRNFKKA